jgi:hypothetical protein
MNLRAIKNEGMAIFNGLEKCTKIEQIVARFNEQAEGFQAFPSKLTALVMQRSFVF